MQAGQKLGSISDVVSGFWNGLTAVAQISSTTVHAYSIKMCYIKRFHLDLRYPSKLKILNTLPMYLGL